MDTYDAIETDQDSIEPAKLIRDIYHLHDDDKQDGMDKVETNKQVYLFYKAPYQSNADNLTSLKAHIKLIKSHNGAVVYHLLLAAIILKIYIISPATPQTSTIILRQTPKPEKYTQHACYQVEHKA